MSKLVDFGLNAVAGLIGAALILLAIHASMTVLVFLLRQIGRG